MVLDEVFKLSNGARIPKVALGTWQTPNDVAADAVVAAIDAGYKHIDTAVVYGNEAGVGAGLKAALEKTGIHRESIFLTTKVPAEVKSYKGAEQSIQESYERLATPHIDMMLIHWPKPWIEMKDPNAPSYNAENLEVWRAMEAAYDVGKIRCLGVSNFSIDDIKNIQDNCKVQPVVNQIRVHIGHVPLELIEYCRYNGIRVEAYSPNATGRLMNVPAVCEMAKKYGVSVPQLANRFCLQLNLVTLPKSTHAERIRENGALDFEISAADMEQLLEMPEI
ncbi:MULTISPECIES: aldo/keto reductase [unclassified Fibrobacter]|uniref:aldo/keto reductase n=1 Tax=unclassified Fibrobacter TaxID=2634177 RepID=UPI00091EBFE8|nr:MULTISPECIES: aldo/keto reductase [unclassified Fibrobacter]MCQ2098681.1 aldo/keto reductase [Fibrobacter sp.]OWV03523.1 2,5-diketo-D-gluconic acid reductase [Fibrobacter sp. UWH3]SHK18907.1 Aldo/keto reductase [Fibrobacter sp. UWH6]SHK36635.1 Aldo/keto reductase [Fibrobacter sp. UWH5]